MWRAGSNLFWLLLCLGCLLAGISLYALLRPLPWMPWPGLMPLSPAWLHQQLPDGLWTAAFASFLMYISRNRHDYIKALLWPLLCVVTMECLQALKLWPGTADVADVSWAGFGCAAVGLIMILRSDEKRAAS